MDQTEDNNLVLESGWSFPPSFNRHSGSIEMSTGLDNIRESLKVLLGTREKERTMELEYGCDLSPLAFQHLDLNIKTFMVNNIKQKIEQHETRVIVDDIKLSPLTEGLGGVLIEILYTVKRMAIQDKIQFTYKS